MKVFSPTDNSLEHSKCSNTHTHIYNQLHFNRKLQKWHKNLFKSHLKKSMEGALASFLNISWVYFIGINWSISLHILLNGKFLQRRNLWHFYKSLSIMWLSWVMHRLEEFQKLQTLHRNHLFDLHSLSEGRKRVDVRTGKLDPQCGFRTSRERMV